MRQEISVAFRKVAFLHKSEPSFAKRSCNQCCSSSAGIDEATEAPVPVNALGFLAAFQFGALERPDPVWKLVVRLGDIVVLGRPVAAARGSG